MSSSEFLLGSTVRGLCRPEDRSNKIKPKVLNWWSKCYFVTLQFPLFHSYMLLQIRLPWNELIHNGARNINSRDMINKSMNITFTSMKSTNLWHFIIVNKIIITISVSHFPNELNQKRSQYPDWYCNYKLPEFSLTLNLFFAFHTIL